MNKIDLGKISRLTFSKRQKKKTIETFKSTSTLFGFKKPFPESPSSASILKKKSSGMEAIRVHEQIR